MHGFQAASQVAVVCSKPESRAVALGRIAMTYSVGWLGGSCMLAWFANMFDPRRVLFMLVGAEAVAVVAIASTYPSAAHSAASWEASVATENIPSEEKSLWNSLLRVAQIPGVLPQLFFKTGVCICGGLICCMVPQFALDPLGFSPSQTSLLMSLLSSIQLVVQGFLVPKMGTPSLRVLQVSTLTLLSLPLLGMAMSPTTGASFILWVAPISVGWQAVNMALNSSLSCLIPEDLAGTSMGISLAPMSAAFLISPMLGATLFKLFGFRSIPLVASISLLGVQAVVELMDRFDHKQDAEFDDRDPC